MITAEMITAETITVLSRLRLGRFTIAYYLYCLRCLAVAPCSPSCYKPNRGGWMGQLADIHHRPLSVMRTLPFTLVPQWFSCLQGMFDSRLCFFRRQQFYKCGSFQLQEPVLVNKAAGGEVPTTHHVRDFAADEIIVLRNEVAFAHVNQQSLDGSNASRARDGDIARLERRLVARFRERDCLRLGNVQQFKPVHHDIVCAAKVSQFLRLLGAF